LTEAEDDAFRMFGIKSLAISYNSLNISSSPLE